MEPRYILTIHYPSGKTLDIKCLEFSFKVDPEDGSPVLNWIGPVEWNSHIVAFSLRDYEFVTVWRSPEVIAEDALLAEGPPE